MPAPEMALRPTFRTFLSWRGTGKIPRTSVECLCVAPHCRWDNLSESGRCPTCKGSSAERRWAEPEGVFLTARRGVGYHWNAGRNVKPGLPTRRNSGRVPVAFCLGIDGVRLRATNKLMLQDGYSGPATGRYNVRHTAPRRLSNKLPSPCCRKRVLGSKAVERRRSCKASGR